MVSIEHVPVRSKSKTKSRGLVKKRVQTGSYCVSCMIPHSTWESVTGLPDNVLKILCKYVGWTKPLDLPLFSKMVHKTRRKIHTICLPCYETYYMNCTNGRIICPATDCKEVIKSHILRSNRGHTGRRETRHVQWLDKKEIERRKGWGCRYY